MMALYAQPPPTIIIFEGILQKKMKLAQVKSFSKTVKERPLQNFFVSTNFHAFEMFCSK